MKGKCVYIVVIVIVVGLLVVCPPASADTWNPANTDGFGEGNDNYDARAMSVFGSYLYVGTWSPFTGCQVWRSPDGTDWNQVNIDGFGDVNNGAAGSMSVFGSYLYVGTWNWDTGCQVWRSSDGITWNQVVGQGPAGTPTGPGFGDVYNQGAFSMSVFGSYLYVGTWNQDTGCQVWRSSDGTDWNQVKKDGFGDGNNEVTASMTVFGSYLYAGTWNGVTGCQVWRSSDGLTWNPANIDGFGDVNNTSIYSMSVFGSHIYIGTTGCQVWRSSDGTTWNQVNEDGFGYDSNWDASSMSVFGSCLYVGTFNPETGSPSTGCQVWKSYDGTTWNPVNIDGFGDVHNWSATSMSLFGPYLYVGTTNGYNGCNVWRTAGTHVVKASVSGGHGSVDPVTQEVDLGSPASIHINPDTGYHIASITDNGMPVPVANPYVINDVREDHDVVATFASDTDTWYLAEGCTAGGMETWVLVENPDPKPVTLDISFHTAEGPFAPAALQGFVLSGNTRASFEAGDYIESYDLSTIVSATGGEVVVERSMYGPDRTWATCSIGTQAPAATWYLAEGCTGEGFETWVLVQNPGDAAVTVDLTLMTGTGEFSPTPAQDVHIPAFSRRSFNLGEYVDDYDVSTLVEATGGEVVAERSVYGDDRDWGTCSIGTQAPAATWYLAEGATGEGFETWVLVQNPGASPVTVDLILTTSAGQQDGPQDVVIPACSRRSFSLGEYVTDYDVSTKVVSTGGGVVVERAMYGTGRTWAHDSIGYAP